jgi:hypothetical protein
MPRVTQVASHAAKIACAVALMVVLPLSAKAQHQPSADTTTDTFTQALRDTLAARLGALEVQRAFLVASGRSPSHPDRVALENQLAALRAYVAELPDHNGTAAVVNQRVLEVIEAHLAGIAVQQRILNVVRPNHPDGQVLAAARAALEQRRTELRALVIGAAVSAPR